MDEFIHYIKNKTSFKLVVFSCPRHLGENINGLTMRQILEKNKIIYYESPDINQDKDLKKEIYKNTLGIGMGASWIFKRETVELFAKNQMLDFMGIDLPRYRGGAHYTWRILHQNRIGSLNFQIIHGGIETFHQGEVVYAEKFLFPKNLRRAFDFFNFQLKKEFDFFKNFLKKVERRDDFKATELNEKESSYFPFLSTKDNGLINWSWGGEDICLFINAFDDPYPGASTYLGDEKIYLKDCRLLKAVEHYHSFTTGIVIRKNSDGIFIAAGNNLLNVKKVATEKGADFMEKIQKGDRLYTPLGELEKALCFKAIYGARGLKRKAS